MAKYRVHELAKELSISNKDIMAMMADIKSHLSLLTEEQVEMVREKYQKKPQQEAEKEKTEAGKDKSERPEKQNRPEKRENRENRDNRKDRPEGAQSGKKFQQRQDRPDKGERSVRSENGKQGGEKLLRDKKGKTDRPDRSDRPERRPEGFRDRDRNERKQGSQTGGKPADRQQKNHQGSRDSKPEKDAVYGKEKRDRQERMEKQEKKNAQQKNNQQKGTNQKDQRSKLRDLSQPQHKKSPKKAKPEKNVEVETDPNVTVINVPITVKGFAEQIERSSTEVIMKLMSFGIMATINQNIDEDTVLLLAEELGVEISIGKVDDDVVEHGIDHHEDKPEELKPRSPIITVMGHVDHGKTSLLDAIRSTNITASESGGITQHIGASEVYSNGNKIVCLDTPGHEAFTAMRARGAQITDIAILVVAADDSVKPQTVEAISHAKAAGVPIIVAINKVDKPDANVDRVKQDLMQHGLVVEEYGGDIICVPVSAKTGVGIDNLLEMVLLQADMLELTANPNRLARGTVVEARLDKAKGPIATVIVQKGTLTVGTPIVAGVCSGRVRAMHNWKGESVKKAGPSTAVEILGLQDVPEAGDEVDGVKEEKLAKSIATNRQIKLREETMKMKNRVSLEALFSQIQGGNMKELNIIVKADVQGSVGAVTQSLEKLSNEEVAVKIVFSGVGTVTESDILLAAASNALIIGFNVRPPANILSLAEREGVEINTYRIIYEAIGDIEKAMKGMLDPEYKEVILGRIEVRTTFKVPGAGTVAGAYVLDGKVQRNAEIRLVRDGIVIHEGKISSLKRFKDDVREVATGYECGIGIENYNDIKEGDIIEAFAMVEIERK